MNTQRLHDRIMTPARTAGGLATLLAAGGLAFCPSSDAQAPDIQPLGAIADIARAFVSSQLHTQNGANQKVLVTVGTLDPRLRLARCSHAPEAVATNPARTASRITVGVRCQQPTWTVYVPVTIESELQVMVLRQSTERGATLSLADVEMQTRRTAGAGAEFLTDPSQLPGRHLRAATAAGTALTSELLVPDILIKRGQRVVLVASVGGLEVRAQGEAVGDASATGRVRVLNLNSRRIVEGQVESTDRVRISL
jgi:flagellar basal body P-ring formation protein FlgA